MRAIVLSLLVGCRSSELLRDYEETLASMQASIDQHAEAVAQVASLEEVVPLEEAYQRQWGMWMDEITDEMEVMEGCSMRDGKREVDMGMMEEADDTMAMMEHDMALHMSDHEDHTELSQCFDEESAHRDTMRASLDAMGEYGRQWSEAGMMCGGSN